MSHASIKPMCSVSRAARAPLRPICSAHRDTQVTLTQRVVPNLLAAATILTTGADFVQPRFVLADEEETAAPKFSQLEKRRELLRQARERAQQAASVGGDAAPAPSAPAPAEAPTPPIRTAPSLKASSDAYEKQAAKSPNIKSVAPLPEPEANSPFAAFKSAPSFTAPSAPAPALPAPPKPAPPPPAPRPAPAPVVVQQAPKPPPPPAKPAPEKVPEAAKPAPAPAAKPGKRRGPLPLWLTEVLVLGAFAGLALGVTKYSTQTSAAGKVAMGKVVEAYQALEKLLPSS